VSGRDPGFITRWLAANQHRLDGPAQYEGDEPGSVLAEDCHGDRDALWEGAPARWLMAASWDYSQAAGNMAIPAVYRAINDAGPAFMCDRWYLPATLRDLELLERGGIPVFGIESRRQLADFDVVGTSISYSVLFMNLCKHLAMSGVPVRRAEREKDPGRWPMIIAGGQAYRAPEFMSPVVDCVWLGEIEDAAGQSGGIGEVCARIAELKAGGAWAADRPGCYDALALEFPHLYFPKHVEFSYEYQDRGLPRPTRMVSGYRSVLAGQALPLPRRYVKQLDSMKPLNKPVLLYTDPGMGSGDAEIGRGCVAWCPFCALSYGSKPARQHSPDYVIENARQVRLNMGGVDISLVAPDPAMHTGVKRMVAGLLENVTDEVDASSMRLDDFRKGDWTALLTIGGTDSLTLGLEGNSERMRALAGKGTTDDDVCEAVRRAIKVGIRKIKLYMISNWPGEDTADVMKVVELGRRLADIRDSFGERAQGVRIQFSWTPLLIESHTPLQWFAVTAPDYSLQDALSQLRDMRIGMKIGSKANPAKLAFFQACQRASRAAGEALADVIAGYGVASWGGFPKDMRDRLDAALKDRGFHNGLDDLFGERFRDDLFGWEHIDTGVSADLLWRVYADMVEFLVGTDAGTYDELAAGGIARGAEWVPRCDHQCQGRFCGACDREDLLIRKDMVDAAATERNLADEPVGPVDHTTVAARLRLKTLRPVRHRWTDNDSLRHIVRRAAYRASAATGFPEIAKRTVRFASDSLSYRERTAGVEYVEFGVTRPFGPGQLETFLAEFDRQLEGRLLWDGFCVQLPVAAKMPHRPPSLWELEVDADPGEIAAALRRWDGAATVMTRIFSDSFYAGEGVVDVNAKDHVRSFWLVRRGHRYVLRMELTGKVGAYQAYAALMGRASWLEFARYPAVRVEFFNGAGPACVGCGTGIPEGLDGVLFDPDFCPRCKDEAAGEITAGLARSGV
jgi:radical SAM superfamily enzyme YgiQ (UPF0313 family)